MCLEAFSLPPCGSEAPLTLRTYSDTQNQLVQGYEYVVSFSCNKNTAHVMHGKLERATVDSKIPPLNVARRGDFILHVYVHVRVWREEKSVF